MNTEVPQSEMINCREAARLLSDAQERELGVSERTRLRLHLAICQACRNVEQQYRFIRSAMQRLGKDERSDD